jgi:hypothetical protein
MIQSMVSTVTNISAYIVCMGAAALVITLLRDPRLTRIVGMLYMLFLSSIVLMIGFVEPPAISLSRLGAIFAVGSCTGTEGTFTSGLIVLAFLRYQLPRMDLTQQLGGIYVENEFEFFREYGFALWWHWVWVFYITNLHMSASTRAQEELEQKNLWLYVSLFDRICQSMLRAWPYQSLRVGQSCHTKCKLQLLGFSVSGSSSKLKLPSNQK